MIGVAQAQYRFTRRDIRDFYRGNASLVAVQHYIGTGGRGIDNERGAAADEAGTVSAGQYQQHYRAWQRPLAVESSAPEALPLGVGQSAVRTMESILGHEIGLAATHGGGHQLYSRSPPLSY